MSPSDTVHADQFVPEQRVRVHFYPKYPDVRDLLRVLSGRPVKQMVRMRRELLALAGSRRKPTSFKNPDEWIPERLESESQELARAIWIESGKAFNPARTEGAWELVRRYELMVTDSAGLLQLTPTGTDFLEQRTGEVEMRLDNLEGLHEVLALVAGHTPTRSRDIFPEWSEYLARYETSMRAEATKRDSLRERLNNLIDRGLVERRHIIYSVTGDGMAYLKRSRHDLRQVRAQLVQREESVRKQLREALHKMDPAKFERLIGRLLEEIGYENVEVVGKSGDGGVDVEADIQVGITWVHEVVQAKRYRGRVSVSAIDALRGALWKFNAIRGTLITTSGFSKPAKEAAFPTSAPPITLVDGDKLVDLLIENGIGVRKRVFSVLDLCLEDFDALEAGYDVEEEADVG